MGPQGVTQLQRVAARDYVLYVQHVVRVPLAARRDGHDNNWLLLEFVLSVGPPSLPTPIPRLAAANLRQSAQTGGLCRGG